MTYYKAGGGTRAAGNHGLISFDFIEWDENNEEHIAQNDVTRDEVEEVLYDPKNEPVVSRSTGRPAVIGETSTGKTLFVAYDVMGDKSFTIIRPATAYEME